MKSLFSHFQKSATKGITILEIIVIISILMILTTASVSNLSTYRSKQVLNGESAQVLSILNKARSQTLASKSQLSYGVRIEADRVTFYPGPTFASVPASHEEYILHHTLGITDIALNGGGSDVLFDRLTGEAPAYGTFRISFTEDATQYHIISISQTGFIGLQE
jgi:type II secretory pathway pseudopilin PulG